MLKACRYLGFSHSSQYIPDSNKLSPGQIKMLEISAPKFSVNVNLTPDSKEQSNILSNANSGLLVKIGLG